MMEVVPDRNYRSELSPGLFCLFLFRSSEFPKELRACTGRQTASGIHQRFPWASTLWFNVNQSIGSYASPSGQWFLLAAAVEDRHATLLARRLHSDVAKRV